MNPIFRQSAASCFVPDGSAPEAALARCTHLGVAAHPDDLEFMACHGILECHLSESKGFGGVICTDGAGSSRMGPFADFTDEEMRAVRRREQEAAAVIGCYRALVQLAYASREVNRPGQTPLVDDLKGILELARPRVVYTHNPADKHETHIGVMAATLAAIRSLPPEQRPGAVWGCEVWRDLDWMPDEEKVALDVSARPDLAEALNRVFESQIAGGKRYDLAVMGRRRANATFFASHAADQAQMLTFAMDLTPLAREESLDVTAYVTGLIDRFREDVAQKLKRYF
ncbi:MAG TPA: PIG-L family deacetylase [Chthoniobacterales bacterium]